MNNSPQRAHRTRGFSLIELLVVIGILAVIAAIVAPSMLGKADDANVNAAKVQIEQLHSAIDLYRLETGRYPGELKDLVENPGDNKRWKGPYVRKKSQLEDPWHNAIQYQRPGDHGAFDLYSFGADGQQGGEGNDADIGNWE